MNTMQLSSLKQLMLYLLLGVFLFAEPLSAQSIKSKQQGHKACSAALVQVHRDNLHGYMDSKGTVVIPAKFRRIADFSEGLAAAADGASHTQDAGNHELWGYIDATGAWIISPSFYEAGPFHSGLATVRDAFTGKAGVINKKGEFIVPPQYDLIGSFSEGVALVGVGEDQLIFGILDNKGKIILDPLLRLNEKYWHDKDLKFSDGLVPAMMAGKWGYVDKKGTFVIPAKYDDAGPFSEGFAFVAMNKRVGIINTKGKLIGVPTYDYYVKQTSNSFNIFSDSDNMRKYRFSGGVSPVCMNGLWGVVNTRGSYVVKPTCVAINLYSDGLALFKNNTGKRGYFDTAGKVVLAIEDTLTVGDFSQGVMVFSDYTKKPPVRGIMDRKGGRLMLDSVGEVDQYGNLRWMVGSKFECAAP